MTVPTIRTGATKGSSSGNETSTTITKPATSPANDIIIVPIGSDASGDTFGFPAGFTELYNDESYQTVATAGVAYKTSSGSEADYTVTTTVSERKVWQAISVNGASGIDVSPASNNGSGTTATFPAMTTTQNDCLGIRVVLTDQNATATTPLGSMTGWTLHDEIFGTSAGGCGIFYKSLPTAGTEASGTCSLNISEQWWTCSFALAPAASGVNVTPGVAAMVLSGVAPSLILSSLITAPGVAALALLGIAPTVVRGSLMLAPGPGIMTLQGIAPTVLGSGISVAPSPGIMALSGIAPSLIKSSVVVAPTFASLALLGIAPTVGKAVNLSPAAAIARLLAIDPTLAFGQIGLLLHLRQRSRELHLRQRSRELHVRRRS